MSARSDYGDRCVPKAHLTSCRIASGREMLASLIQSSSRLISSVCMRTTNGLPAPVVIGRPVLALDFLVARVDFFAMCTDTTD